MNVDSVENYSPISDFFLNVQNTEALTLKQPSAIFEIYRPSLEEIEGPCIATGIVIYTILFWRYWTRIRDIVNKI